MSQQATVPPFVPGLAGVIAAQSHVGFVDGENGILEYRGIPIEKLAEHSTFEETTYLLLYGALPTRAELAAFSDKLKSHREVRPELLDMIASFPKDGHPMAALQTIVGAMGLFYPFLDDKDVGIIGVEAGGKGVNDKMEHCASLTGGRPGVLHGSLSYLLQDRDGQVAPAHSISAGLDYPGVGPEHAHLKDSGRAKYVSVSDEAAKQAFRTVSSLEGIVPALESAHAVAHVLEVGPGGGLPAPVLVCLSGRGDKDVVHVARTEGRGPDSELGF